MQSFELHMQDLMSSESCSLSINWWCTWLVSDLVKMNVYLNQNSMVVVLQCKAQQTNCLQSFILIKQTIGRRVHHSSWYIRLCEKLSKVICGKLLPLLPAQLRPLLEVEPRYEHGAGVPPQTSLLVAAAINSGIPSNFSANPPIIVANMKGQAIHRCLDVLSKLLLYWDREEHLNRFQWDGRLGFLNLVVSNIQDSASVPQIHLRPLTWTCPIPS